MYRNLVVVGLVAACGSGKAPPRDAPIAVAVAKTTQPPVPPVPPAPTPRYAATASCPGAAEVFAAGKSQGWICPDDAAAARLTIVDLSDQWAPRVFAPGPDGKAPSFRTTYLALAAETSADGDELEPEEQFVELYGVVPNLTVMARRLADDARHACHDAIDEAPLAAFHRTLSQVNDAEVRLGDRKRAWLAVYLERERVKRRLPDLDALTRIKALQPSVAAYHRLVAQRDALLALEAHLVCEGILDRRAVDGLFTWRTGLAVERYQRKHFLVPNAVFDDETRAAMIAGSREQAFRGVLRTLRERVTDATGLIEDGTAGAGPLPILGRQLEPAIMRGAFGYKPLARAAPDLIGQATIAAVTELGWTDVAPTREWLANHPGGERVALALPPPPDYHGPRMDLVAEIDRGDVWYDARPAWHPVRRRPALTLYAVVGGERRPLVRWPTTIGGWADQRTDSGYVVQRWKESNVGPRVWRDMYAAPVWYPPPTTPDRDLVVNLWNGHWRLKREVFGPGPRSAYGMVELIHHWPMQIRHKLVMGDQGVRTHGSASVTSIANGTSHGCHRLFNHLAVRLGGFLLDHRAYIAHGEAPDPYLRFVSYKGRFVARLQNRGFLYELTPPVPIDVLPGSIRSARKVPPVNSAPARP